MPPAPLVLVPGAGGDGRYWDRVLPLLPDAVTLDLPPDAAGFDDYVDAVAAVLPDEPAVLVGQSMGAFTVALVAARFPTRAVVLLAPMVPAPGDTAGSWWERTGHAAAVTDAAIISKIVDGTILVVRAFRTTKALGRHGLRSLTDVDANIVGSVLNAVDFQEIEYRYQGYRYYQAEGYGNTSPAPAPADGSVASSGHDAPPPN